MVSIQPSSEAFFTLGAHKPSFLYGGTAIRASGTLFLEGCGEIIQKETAVYPLCVPFPPVPFGGKSGKLGETV